MDAGASKKKRGRSESGPAILLMRINSNNLAIDYSDNGSGIPLLLIHGYPLSRALWEPQVTGLADVARVLALDLRGHGGSDVGPESYSMSVLADDCRRLLDTLGIAQPVVLGGLSMGGYVVFEFYRKYPQRIAGLILAATRAGADSPEAKANRDTAATTAREKGVGAIVETMLPKILSQKSFQTRPKLVTRVRKLMASTPLAAVLGDLAAMRDRADSTAILAQIDKPTLILHGADDQLIPPAEAQATGAAIPNARLQILPEAGHLLNLEQPEAFNEAVRGFLSSI
jgi:3-oxoadipate enol-lactonase